MDDIKALSDFNDLHVYAGLDAVKQQIESALSGSVINPEIDAANERKHSLGGSEEIPEDAKVGRLDLQECLKRFLFLSPSGQIWDDLDRLKMKKTVFKDMVGAATYKAWNDHEDRKVIQDEMANSILRKIAKEKARAMREQSDQPVWQERFQFNDNGSIKADIANAMLVLENDLRWKGVLGYCDFSYRIIKRKAPPFGDSEPGEWTDTDTDRLRIWFSDNYAFTPKNADAHGAVVVAAERNRFHPVREYLASLQWDGVPRVENWLSVYLGAESTRYHRLVARMFLISAIARVMQPPVKVDSVLILEGLQGLGKSTCISILAGAWFTDTPIVLGDKDGFQQMQGSWVIELAELDSLNKAESTRAKQFFGSKEDRYRPSYGRMVQCFPRQCVFVGSTNQESYLRDATGNRRYWPVMCNKVEKDLLAQDRDQLWAEAFHMYRSGIPWWPQESDKHLFEESQEQRFESDVWEDLIYEWLRTSTTADTVTAAEIMSGALSMDPAHMKPPEQKRVGQIMAHLGWRKTRPRDRDGKRVTGYERPLSWVADKAGQGGHG
jgi:putative DNA primase/helicase